MAATVDQKLLKQTKFPPEFSKKVDMKKVNVEVMKKWISGKISEILGNEDDVVIELCFNLLEGSRFPDIKVLQIQLTGFLDKDTPKFCKELWNLCLSAQENPQGVPKELLEAKKLELIQEKIDAEKAAEEMRRRKETERQRDRNVDGIRNRERAERGRGRGRGGRGDQGGYRPSYNDRSPPPSWRGGPPRDRSLTPPGRDSHGYPPRGRGGRGQGDRRYRSPPRRYREDRPASPPPRRRRNSSSEASNGPGNRDPRDGRSGQRSPGRKPRARSYSSSSSSRSPSPRPRRRRSQPGSRSPSSRSPPRRRRRYSSDSASASTPSRGGTRRRRRTPTSGPDGPGEKSAGLEKGRSPPGRRRDTSSRSASSSPPRRRRRSPDSDSRSPSTTRSRSRSRSRDKGKAVAGDHEGKRQRSLERYAAAPRRRRHASSSVDSLPHREKRRRADEPAGEKEREGKGKPPEGPDSTVAHGDRRGKRSRQTELELLSHRHSRNLRLSPVPQTPQDTLESRKGADTSPDVPSGSPKPPNPAPLKRTSNELKERILKERLLARRRASNDPIQAGASAAEAGNGTSQAYGAARHVPGHIGLNK